MPYLWSNMMLLDGHLAQVSDNKLIPTLHLERKMLQPWTNGARPDHICIMWHHSCLIV